jgi:hypothetical protein
MLKITLAVGTFFLPFLTAHAMTLRSIMVRAVGLCVFAIVPRVAHADDAAARALSSSFVMPANSVLRDIMAQAIPVGTPHRPLSSPGLPTGLSYTVDASIAFPYGQTGTAANLPGGIDAVLGYGINRRHRITAGYYEFQEYPFGFNTGTVPVYLQGLASPVGTENLNTAPIDVATKNKILTFVSQNLFLIGGKFPIVISPTYLARTANIGGHGDTQLVEINGFPQTLRLRSSEEYLVPLTVPFLATPKLFGTLTGALQWNVNLNGANSAPNHAQVFELLYLEYRANRSTTFFVQPSRLVQYFAIDPDPEYVPTLLFGVSHKFTKYTFVQMMGSTGGASNRKQPGITSITCQQIAPNGQCAVSAPSISGLHAAQVQIQFGVGSPSVIPL